MSKHTERGSMESSAASGLNFEDTALTLRFPGSSSDPERKRASTSVPNHGCPCAPASDSPPSAKAGVVGWPPVRSFRKNALAAAAVSKAKFVKVAVDGALYLRKVDLEVYTGYDQLLAALQDKFFSHFTVCKVGNDEMELVEAVSGTEYVPTYVDKDQDWMLVGDVPWKYDDTGFKINNVKYEGTLLIVENKIMTWTPKTFAEITAESLSIFRAVHPIPEILILGCGRHIQAISPELRKFIRSTRMKLEAIDSRSATSTYNILNEEG